MLVSNEWPTMLYVSFVCRVFELVTGGCGPSCFCCASGEDVDNSLADAAVECVKRGYVCWLFMTCGLALPNAGIHKRM